MTEAERVAWLRLAALNETARRKQRWLAAFGTPAALFEADEHAWAEAGLDPGLRERIRKGGRLDVAGELARLDELGIELVPRGDVRYPPLLATIADPAPVLFVRGTLPPVSRPCVALVGTRRASPYGELVAEDLARGLAEVGVGVVSGLAAGIDAAAHRGTLRAGGYTAAVLGNGLDRIFPEENRALYERVGTEGAVISEFRLGTEPRPWHFPMRNRLISGLCRAVVVVQAPARSGALITARCAAEQDREVLAVPGNITDTRQAGCHDLIRDGARLVRGVDDVLEALGLRAEAADEPTPSAPALPALTATEAAVAGAVGLVPASIDDLIEQTRLATPEVQSALVTLELKQVVRRLPGNRFVRLT